MNVLWKECLFLFCKSTRDRLSCSACALVRMLICVLQKKKCCPERQGRRPSPAIAWCVRCNGVRRFHKEVRLFSWSVVWVAYSWVWLLMYPRSTFELGHSHYLAGCCFFFDLLCKRISHHLLLVQPFGLYL